MFVRHEELRLGVHVKSELELKFVSDQGEGVEPAQTPVIRSLLLMLKTSS